MCQTRHETLLAEVTEYYFTLKLDFFFTYWPLIPVFFKAPGVLVKE